MADSRVDILLSLKSKLEGAENVLGFLGDVAKGFTVVGTVMAGLELTKKAGELAGEIKKLAAEGNFTTEAFQALKVAAMGYNIDQETLVRGSVTLRKNLEDAAKEGASPLNRYLAQLNLTAAGLQALAPERQFEVIGRAIAGAVDKEAAFAAGMELLGAKSAPKLMEFLRELGAEGFDKFARSAKAITLTKEELETLDQAASAWERMVYAVKILAARGVLVAGSSVNAVAKAAAQGRPANPNAVETQIALLEKRIASFREHGLENDPRTKEYERTLAILQARLQVQKSQEAQADAAQRASEADEKSKMAAADLKATLDGLDKQGVKTGQKVGGFDTSTLNSAIEAGRKAVQQDQERQQKEAENYKNLADPLRTYKKQLEEIAFLKQQDLLTDQEATAATKAVTQAMLEREGELGAHARRLSELQQQRQLIEKDPFMSAADKQSRLAEILRQENAELDRQIAMLREKQNLTPQESRQLEGLVNRRTDNQFNPAGFDTRQTINAELMGYANSFGTVSQQVAGAIRNTIGRAVDTVAHGIAGWITGTMTWGQMLQSLGMSVLEELISTIIRIGVQWVINATIGKTIQASMAAATMATTGMTAAAISAMMIAPATLATIASFGGAAAAAPEEIMAALGASAGLGLFSEGGHTGPGGVVHQDEWVAPAWMVSHPLYSGIIDGLESARTGGGSTPAPVSAPGGDGRPTRFIHVMAQTRGQARELSRDPEFDNVMLDWAHRNRGELVSS